MKKTIKKILWQLLVMVMVLSTAMTSVVAEDMAAADLSAPPANTLRILHTNDIHGRYQYQEASGKNNAVLGFDRLKTLAKGDEKTKEADMILDAGDIFHGQAFASLEAGSSIAELMKSVGYTAMTPGNHDFNYTADVLKNTLEEASGATILSCNVKEKVTGDDYFTPYMTKELENGVKVGLFGITSPDIYDSTAPINVEGIEFVDPIEPANEAVKALKAQGCTVIIALAHMGNSTELTWKTNTVAEKVDGIDMIIDGHTHVEDNHTVKRPDGKETLIVQTGYAFQNAGEINVTLDADNKVAAVSADNEKLISYKEAPSIVPDEETAALTAAIEERQKDILEEVIGTTPVKLEGKWELVRYQQTNMGNLITDAYIDTTGADVAFENAGGIRKEAIEPGNIIQKDIIEMAPFGNNIITKKIMGQTILDMLEVSLQQGIDNKFANDNAVDWPKGSGSFLQWGGIDVVYKPDNLKGERVISAVVNGVALDTAREYTVATNSKVAESPDYPALAKAPELNQYAACDESITAYISKPDNAWQKSLKANHFVLYEKPAPDPEPEPTPGQEEPAGTPEKDTNQTTAGVKNPLTGQVMMQDEVNAIVMVGLVVLMLLGLGLYQFKKRQKN